jgi:hypothetical protein
MHLASYHPEDDPDRRPSDEPPAEVHEAPGRQPIIGFYSKRGFFSMQTGRWEQLAGGQDDADGRDGQGGS